MFALAEKNSEEEINIPKLNEFLQAQKMAHECQSSAETMRNQTTNSSMIRMESWFEYRPLKGLRNVTYLPVYANGYCVGVIISYSRAFPGKGECIT